MSVYVCVLCLLGIILFVFWRIQVGGMNSGHPPIFKLPRVHTTRLKSSFINYAVDHYVWSRLILKCLIIVSCRCSNERVNVFILYYLHLWVFLYFCTVCNPALIKAAISLIQGILYMSHTPCFIKSGPLCIFSITFSNVDWFEWKLHQCIC